RTEAPRHGSPYLTPWMQSSAPPPGSSRPPKAICYFLSKETSPTQIYTLSLHDALPISLEIGDEHGVRRIFDQALGVGPGQRRELDRKSTRLNSSHVASMHAVFCLTIKPPSWTRFRPPAPPQ